MKTRDSGMPDQVWWETFFDPDAIFDALDLRDIQGVTIDIGCGYGTFTVAIAKRTTHPVIGIDIDPAMVAQTQERAHALGLRHVSARLLDATTASFGVAAGSTDLILIFNLLHCERPADLVQSAATALRPGGRLAAIHWRRDMQTPRGPDLSIRPSPEEMSGLLRDAGFQISRDPVILPPFHVGLVGTRMGPMAVDHILVHG